MSHLPVRYPTHISGQQPTQTRPQPTDADMHSGPEGASGEGYIASDNIKDHHWRWQVPVRWTVYHALMWTLRPKVGLPPQRPKDDLTDRLHGRIRPSTPLPGLQHPEDRSSTDPSTVQS